MATDAFSALAHPVRRAILMKLRGGPRRAGDLAGKFSIGRPAVSEHLAVLRRARLVREEPRGRERYYHLNARPLAKAGAWIQAFSGYWEARLDALETLLEERNEDA